MRQTASVSESMSKNKKNTLYWSKSLREPCGRRAQKDAVVVDARWNQLGARTKIFPPCNFLGQPVIHQQAKDVPAGLGADWSP